MSEDKIINIISKQLNIEKSNIEFIEKGSEGFIYSFLDSNGDKKIIKIFSNIISVKKDPKKIKEKSEITEKFIQNSIKTLKISENGLLEDEDGKEIFYQISDYFEYSLFDLVVKNKIDPYETYLIALKIVIGICSLHKIEIAHRDLKLENIMINLKEKKVKIIDFGFTDKVDKNKKYKAIGTKEYAAPELFFGIVNSKNILATDIYSLGILLFNLMTRSGYLMNLINNKTKHFNKHFMDDRLNYLDSLKDNVETKLLPYETLETRIEFLNLLKQMISINSSDRPCANEILEKMIEIFFKIEKERIKQKKEEHISLKPREKIIIEMFTNKSFFNINKKELEDIAEKNIKKIKNILENNETTNNLKNCVRESIDRILNNNIFIFKKKGEPKKLDINESLKFKKVENHLKEILFIKNTYYFNEIKNKEQNKFIQNLESITNFINHDSSNKEEQNLLSSNKI